MGENMLDTKTETVLSSSGSILPPSSSWDEEINKSWGIEDVFEEGSEDAGLVKKSELPLVIVSEEAKKMLAWPKTISLAHKLTDSQLEKKRHLESFKFIGQPVQSFLEKMPGDVIDRAYDQIIEICFDGRKRAKYLLGFILNYLGLFEVEVEKNRLAREKLENFEGTLDNFFESYEEEEIPYVLYDYEKSQELFHPETFELLVRIRKQFYNDEKDTFNWMSRGSFEEMVCVGSIMAVEASHEVVRRRIELSKAGIHTRYRSHHGVGYEAHMVVSSTKERYVVKRAEELIVIMSSLDVSQYTYIDSCSRMSDDELAGFAKKVAMFFLEAQKKATENGDLFMRKSDAFGFSQIRKNVSGTFFNIMQILRRRDSRSTKKFRHQERPMILQLVKRLQKVTQDEDPALLDNLKKMIGHLHIYTDNAGHLQIKEGNDLLEVDDTNAQGEIFWDFSWAREIRSAQIALAVKEIDDFQVVSLSALALRVYDFLLKINPILVKWGRQEKAETFLHSLKYPHDFRLELPTNRTIAGIITYLANYKPVLAKPVVQIEIKKVYDKTLPGFIDTFKLLETLAAKIR